MTFQITIRYEDETYLVYQDDDFIMDNDDLLTAVRWALEVSRENPLAPPVVIEGVES